MSPLSRRDFLTSAALVAAGSMATATSAGARTGSSAAVVGRDRRSAQTAAELDPPSGGPKLTAPYAVTASCTLAEDYLLVNPRALESAAEKVMSFQVLEGGPENGTSINSGTHTIVMTGTGATAVLSHVRPDPSQPSGFSAQPISNTLGVTDFVVSNIPDLSQDLSVPGGVVELFCLRSTSVSIYRMAADGKTWVAQADSGLPWSGSLDVNYFQTVGYNALVYAWDKAKQTLFWRITDGVHTEQGQLIGFTSTVIGMPAMTVLFTNPLQFKIIAALPGAVMAVWTIDVASGPISIPRPQQLLQAIGPTTVRAVEAVDSIELKVGASTITTAYAVLSDGVGDLYTFTPLPTVPTYSTVSCPKIWDHTLYRTATEKGTADQIAPLQVYNSGAPVLDLLVISGDTMWIQHQIPDDGLAPNFVPPIPLVPGVSSAAVALTPSQQEARTLVTVDPHGAIAILSQSEIDQSWSSQAVLVEGQSPEQVDTYRVQLSVSDANGIPVTNAPITITADSPGLALTSSGATSLGSASSPFTTDSYGRVVLSLVADGLSAPNLTVAGNGLTSATVSPARDVHAFLGGTGSLHQSGYTFTVPNLQGAKANGQALVPGLSGTDAGVAVGLATAAMQAGLNQAAPGEATGPLRLGRRPRHVQGPVSAGTLEMTASNFGKDFWHAIKTGVAKVDSVAKETGKDVYDVYLTIAGWGSQLINAAVTTVEDAVHVAHSVFNKIGAAIDDAIAWLREGITAILHDAAQLADAMYAWLTRVPAFVNGYAKSFTSKADDFFDTLEADLNDALSTVPDLTLTDLVRTGKVGATRGRPRPAARQHVHRRHTQLGVGSSTLASVDPHSFSSNNHACWLLHKVLAELDGSISTSNAASGLGQAIIGIDDSGGAFASSIKGFWTGSGSNSGLLPKDSGGAQQHVGGLSTQTIVGGLGGVVDALITLTKDVADEFLEVIIKVCTLLQTEVFEATLGELPLVGPLLAKFAPSLGELSFGKLICLLIAFPVAFIYQLANGVGATPLAALLPATAASRRPSLGDRPRAGQLSATGAAGTVLDWLAAGAQGVWAFFDVILDVAVDEPTPLMSAIDIITPIVITTVTCPGTTDPYVDVPLGTNAERMQFAAWLSSFLPPLTSAAMYLDFTEKKTLRSTYNGPMLISGFGTYIMVYGIIANGVDHNNVNAGNWVSTICGGMTVIDGILGAKEVIDDTDEISNVVKVVIDFFCGIGAAVGMAFSE